MGVDIRCRNCEEVTAVLDICEMCERSVEPIEPAPIRLCGRGHIMSSSGLRYYCDACRRMRHAAYRARAREQRLWDEVHS